MSSMITPAVEVVNPVPAGWATIEPESSPARDLVAGEYAEYEAWSLANAEALEAMADEAECYERYESGCYAW